MHAHGIAYAVSEASVPRVAAGPTHAVQDLAQLGCVWVFAGGGCDACRDRQLCGDSGRSSCWVRREV